MAWREAFHELLLAPDSGKLPVSTAGRDNSGQFLPERVLFCCRREKANQYLWRRARLERRFTHGSGGSSH